MIISHKYKFIFLKTLKTAGTSIEISLSRFCEKDDIITPISRKDENIRKELGVLPQNYNCLFTHKLPLRLIEYNPRDFRRLINTGKLPQKKNIFWNHIPAKSVKKLIDPEIWNSYFKFSFARNPWDFAISMYYFQYYKKNSENSRINLKHKDLIKNFNIYTIDKKVAVDYIGKYETLLKDLCFISEKLSIPFDNWLPNAKGNCRRDRRHYSEILTESQANFIAKVCADEIELLGYEF